MRFLHYMEKIAKFCNEYKIHPEISDTHCSIDEFKIVVTVGNTILCLKNDECFLTINGSKFVQTNPYAAIRMFFNLVRGAK